jgi:hypothetical protein
MTPGEVEKLRAGLVQQLMLTPEERGQLPPAWGKVICGPKLSRREAECVAVHILDRLLRGDTATIPTLTLLSGEDQP